MPVIKLRNCYKYFFALTILLVSCTDSPTQTIHENKTTTASAKTTEVVIPTTLSSKIPLPSGLVLISQCYEASENCDSSLWLDNYDGRYRQLPFAGSQLRLSHNRQIATFEKNSDIWLIDLKNEQTTNLTNTSDYYENSVTWSPDDEAIAFLSSSDETLTDIFIMDIVSRGRTNVTNTPSRYERCLNYPLCSFGWWSQYPSFIFTGSGKPRQHQLGEIPRGHCHTLGGECNTFPIRISLDEMAYTILDEVNGVEHLPSLSPNGKLLAYDGGVLYNLETDEQKIIYPSDYGLTVEFSNETGSPGLVAPVWSPNGELIAWLGHTNNRGDIGLYVFDLAHGSGQLFTSYSPYFATLTLAPWQRWSNSQITWSPDGQWITFSDSEWSKLGENGFLWIFSSDGKTRIKLDTGDYAMTAPVWSPDSEKIIFVQLFYFNTGIPPALRLFDVTTWKGSQIDIPEDVLLYPVGWFDS